MKKTNKDNYPTKELGVKKATQDKEDIKKKILAGELTGNLVVASGYNSDE